MSWVCHLSLAITAGCSYLEFDLNIRASNWKGFGFPIFIFAKPGCNGFKSRFHSPSTATEGTCSATERFDTAHSAPIFLGTG